MTSAGYGDDPKSWSVAPPQHAPGGETWYSGERIGTTSWPPEQTFRGRLGLSRPLRIIATLGREFPLKPCRQMSCYSIAIAVLNRTVYARPELQARFPNGI